MRAVKARITPLILLMLLLSTAPAAVAEVPPQVFYFVGVFAGILEVIVGYKKTLDELQAMRAWVQQALNETLQRVKESNNATLKKVAKLLNEALKKLDRVIADYNATLARLVKHYREMLLEARRMLNKTKEYVDLKTADVLERLQDAIESYNRSLRWVLEQVDRKLNRTLEAANKRIEALAARVAAIDSAIDSLNSSLWLLEERTSRLEAELETIEDALANLNVSRWIALAREVEVLAGLYSTVYNRTQVLESRMAGLQAEAARVGLLESKANNLEAKLAALESRLASLVARVASLESSLKQYYNYTQAMLQHYYTYISDRDARLKSKITMLEYSLLATTSLGLVAAAAASLMLGVSMRRFYTTGAG